MRFYPVLLAACLCTPLAQAQPFASADPKAGASLHAKQCVSCHVSMFGGDGSEMYTRANHRVSGSAQLLARVAACSANTNAGWFPEDEQNVAAYLNQQYYKFKK